MGLWQVRLFTAEKIPGFSEENSVVSVCILVNVLKK